MKPVQPSRMALTRAAGRHCSPADMPCWAAVVHCGQQVGTAQQDPLISTQALSSTALVAKLSTCWANPGSPPRPGQGLSLQHCTGSHLQSCLSMSEVGSCCHHKVVLQGRSLPEQLQERCRGDGKRCCGPVSSDGGWSRLLGQGFLPAQQHQRTARLACTLPCSRGMRCPGQAISGHRLRPGQPR